MKDLVIKYARDNGILAGVCNCDRLRVFDENELKDTPFTTSDIKRRLEPCYTFPWAKSIIVVGVGYKKTCAYPDDAMLRGRISMSAAGLDYHILVIEKLRGLAELLQSRVRFTYRCFADTGDLVERALAVSAGLGYIGKNRAVISDRLGSLFNIGYMLTDLDLEPDKPKDECCPKSCRLCITACPGKALSHKEGDTHGTLDYHRCVSYLTQKKACLTDAEMKSMGNWIYGCDICQTVCPKNERVEADVIDDIDMLYPGLDKIMGLNNSDFKESFGSTALYWRGRKTIARNAGIAKENLKRE